MKQLNVRFPNVVTTDLAVIVNHLGKENTSASAVARAAMQVGFQVLMTAEPALALEVIATCDHADKPEVNHEMV